MRILVADDMPNLRMLARVTLAGHEVVEAHDGVEAIQLVRNGRPDVVILDVNMPGLTGLQVCEEIRRDPSLSATHVIVITANSQEDARRAFDAGADAFLGKPFSPRALGDLVSSLASRTRAQRQA